jgi:hypothetical protein
VSIGAWTDQDDGTADIYTSIDEAAADDDDYIQSEQTPSESPATFSLSSLADPSRSDFHKVRYRYRRSSTDDALDLTVTLLEGATTRATWAHTGISDSWTTAEQTLTGEEADSITDYSALRIRFTADAQA